jgi:hypothetical protein
LTSCHICQDISADSFGERQLNSSFLKKTKLFFDEYFLIWWQMTQRITFCDKGKKAERQKTFTVDIHKRKLFESRLKFGHPNFTFPNFYLNK